MVVSVNEQLYAFGAMLLGGALSGFLGDVFFLIRVAFGFKRITTNLADLLLWLILAVGIFALNLQVNDGALRWYGILGLILGAVLYFLTLSRIVRVVLGLVLKIFRKILGIILKIVLTILGFLYKILRSVLSFFRHMLAPVGKGVCRTGDAVKRRWYRFWLVLKKK